MSNENPPHIKHYTLLNAVSFMWNLKTVSLFGYKIGRMLETSMEVHAAAPGWVSKSEIEIRLTLDNSTSKLGQDNY